MSSHSKKARRRRRWAQPFTAVLDTNVLVEMYAGSDVFATYQKLSVTLETLDDEAAVKRRARARNSLLLADYLHKQRAKTYGLHSERVSIITRCVPPKPTEPATSKDDAAIAAYNLLITTKMVHVVKDRIFDRWTHHLPKKPDGHRATAADDALVVAAQKYQVVLITNEKTELPHKGKNVGVTVMTPREFLVGKIDDAQAAGDILNRYCRAAEKYLEELAGEERDRERDHLLTVMGYLEHILLGRTNGRDPVVVTHAGV